MSDTENQMGLFELGDSAAEMATSPAPPAPTPPPRPQTTVAPKAAAKPRVQPPAPKKGRQAKAPVKAVSGLVPEGDVRLTANIRQDLHLKLKIASAYRRTTIGEIIEELVEKYV